MANNKFFRSLPEAELTPMEHALRKALFKAARGMGGKPFPLAEWIDRRVGGEFETVQGQGGLVEVRLRGEEGESTAPPRAAAAGGGAQGGPEAFFATLPTDSFDPPEEALRDAVFEFLATWSSPQLAGLAQMQQYPEVQRRSRAFLPRHIQLKDWIENRIGGEIEFRPSAHGDVVHLTESARGAVMAKFQQMSAQPIPGPPPRSGKGGMAPPMGGKGGMAPHGGGPPPPTGGQDKDQFFNTLPRDSLLQKEHALREAILNWINSALIDESRKDGPLYLSGAHGGPDVKEARQAFLPKQVKLSDWIERRIGGEVELRPANNGQHEVYLRGQLPKQGAVNAEEIEKFFAALPEDDFTEAEDNLRVALLEFIDRWKGQGPPTVKELQPEEDVQAAKKELLRKGCKVGLKVWIDRRIGGEIETQLGPAGDWSFGLRGTMGNKKRRTA